MGASQPLIKVLLADDHILFRDGLRLLLQSQVNKEIELLDEACGPAGLPSLLRMHNPQVVLTTLSSSTLQNISMLHALREHAPHVKVIALVSEDSETKTLELFLQEGVSGFILKNSAREEVLAGIRIVARDEVFFCDAIARKMLSVMRAARPPIQHQAPKFSAQELRIVRLICHQYTTKEIASELHLCTRTIEDYRHQIQEKTGARNAVGIVLYAIFHHLVELKELEREPG